MLNIKPIPESEAEKPILSIYQSIKQTLGSSSTPLIFQYLANFSEYLSFIWPQISHNSNDILFRKEINDIENLNQVMVNEIFQSGIATELFLQKIQNLPEKYELIQFSDNLKEVSALLYLISLSLRESLKGQALGVKLIENKTTDKEQSHAVWNDISSEFFSHSISQDIKASNLNIQLPTSNFKKSQSLTTTPYPEFFKLMQWEMDKLIVEEKYLFARVEMEKYALNKLHLIPHPINSSLKIVSSYTKTNPLFPELIHLLAEYFPTQTPYRLFAASVMNRSLNFNPKSSKEETPVKSPILLPAAIELNRN
ncbi:MAG: hypothetical protein UT63_C0043G0006 [Candidatus Gottesmanbacteria bacterium GW2011_GWC2_39_8]|uniref:Uncharacterized protein n=1 Tax=Candidatus Gottesmanbacteria bacterium GW2011_GWC2_39_8 TaxID=1618450 RepID=A0A0G0PWC1_9BACT|nr:MAG: hypothetical protein UT63_C0043G0006 [Candidatus Gottesmanbacteria bacterium GW2011_GWC2_39_8]